jgi:hypothetical protein
MPRRASTDASRSGSRVDGPSVSTASGSDYRRCRGERITLGGSAEAADLPVRCESVRAVGVLIYGAEGQNRTADTTIFSHETAQFPEIY